MRQLFVDSNLLRTSHLSTKCTTNVKEEEKMEEAKEGDEEKMEEAKEGDEEKMEEGMYGSRRRHERRNGHAS